MSALIIRRKSYDARRSSLLGVVVLVALMGLCSVAGAQTNDSATDSSDEPAPPPKRPAKQVKRQRRAQPDDSDSAQTPPSPEAAPRPEARTGSGDEGTSTSRPNALSIELLGRGALYSIDYDRSVSSSVGLGFGFSYFGASDQGITFSAAVVPFYVNFYFAPGPSRVFISGGADFVYVSANVQDYLGFSATGVLGTAGVGYEYRGDGGFLFRLAPYVLIGAGGTQVWGGVSFGYAF